MSAEAKLKGEGDVERISRIRVRKYCEVCVNKPAKYKHTYLLEGMRNNPASAAYCKDDCSYCEDAAIFTCGTCKPDIPDGYVSASRFECNDRFAHLFLEWEEMDEPHATWACHMRQTLIDSANMCMARFNASGDNLFQSLAMSMVVLGNLSYEELDNTVWPVETYKEATEGP